MAMLTAEQKLDELLERLEDVLDPPSCFALADFGFLYELRDVRFGNEDEDGKWYPSPSDDAELTRIYNRVVLGVGS